MYGSPHEMCVRELTITSLWGRVICLSSFPTHICYLMLLMLTFMREI